MKKTGLKILGFGFRLYFDESGHAKTEFMAGLKMPSTKNKQGYLIASCRDDVCKPACLYGME